MSRLLREPLLYFLAAGAALFFIGDVLGDDPNTRIVVSDAQRDRLAAQWRAQMGRPPSADELNALIEQWIREEIYYREAVAMGLDQDDVILRRRLAQKLTFLTEDLATAVPPGEAALQDYYAAHADRYRQAERFTFSHRFFSTERHDDARAAALEALPPSGSEPAPGDPFMLQSSYVERSTREIAQLFGREFAAALPTLPLETWSEPVPSAYGWHLVRVDARRPARQLAYPEVAERVLTDYLQTRREQANEAQFAALRARYQVVRE